MREFADPSVVDRSWFAKTEVTPFRRASFLMMSLSNSLVRGCSVYTLRLAERLGDVLGFWLVGGHCTSRYTSYWAYKNLSRQRSSAFKIFVARRKLATPQVLIAQSREFCLKSVFHKFGKGQPGRKTCQVKRGVSRFVDQLCRDIQSGSYFRRRLGRKLRHSSGRLVEVC
jgi:hypothetical protein